MSRHDLRDRAERSRSPAQSRPAGAADRRSPALRAPSCQSQPSLLGPKKRRLYPRMRRAECRRSTTAEAKQVWWPRPESNQRHTDFQSAALPTELLGRAGASGNRSARKGSADYKGKVLTPPRSWCVTELPFARPSPREITTPEPCDKKSPPQGRAR